jgi:hypothetical protein
MGNHNKENKASQQVKDKQTNEEEQGSAETPGCSTMPTHDADGGDADDDQ